MSPGSYSCKITDKFGEFTYVGSFIQNIDDCKVPVIYDLTYTILDDGIVDFRVYATGGKVYEIDFGNGTSLKMPGGKYQYNNPGTYEVCLTASNDYGNTRLCKTITIKPPKTPDVGHNVITVGSQNLLNNLSVVKACECNNRMFFIASSSGNLNQFIYVLNEDTNESIKLPVDGISVNATKFKGITDAICYNNMLYFAASQGTSGYELFRSDGTINGTNMVADYVPHPNRGINPKNFIILNNILYFDGFEEDNIGWASEYPFKYDGNSITRLTQFDLHGFYSSRIYKNKIIYLNPYHLEITDGNTFAQLRHAGNSGHIMLGEVNGYILFWAYTTEFGWELWRTDGTIAGTSMVKDINPGSNSARQNFETNYVILNNKLFFSADNGQNGVELRSSDGTAQGTNLIKDIFPGNQSSRIANFTIFKNKVYFAAYDGVHGIEMWATDGTAIDTNMLYDNYPGQESGTTVETWEYGTIFTDDKYLYFNGQNKTTLGLFFTDGSSTPAKIFSNAECSTVSGFNGYFSSKGNLYMNTGYGLKKVCRYTNPVIRDRIVTKGETVSFSLNDGRIPEWYSSNQYQCQPGSNLSTYSFVANNDATFRLRAMNADGCKTELNTVRVHTKEIPTFELSNIALCNTNQLRIILGSLIEYNTDNVFKVFLVKNLVLTEIQVTKNGNELIGQIPANYDLTNTDIRVSTTSPVSNSIGDYSLPSIYNSVSAYLLGNQTLGNGSTANLAVLFSGSPPYSFTLNNQIYNNIKDNPYRVSVSPSLSTTYTLSNVSNSCGTSNIVLPTAKIIVCQNTIAHQSSIDGGTYKVLSEINSRGKINSDVTVEYNAGGNIKLSPGFEAKKGSVFKALIAGCQ